MTIQNLSEIKVLSAAAFESVSTTDDSKLYFVEEDTSGGTITEYLSGTSGYLIFPNGMCIQWGAKTSSGSQSLSKTYESSSYVVLASSGASNRYGAYGTVSSASQISVGLYSGSGTVYWMTIGQLASGQY